VARDLRLLAGLVVVLCGAVVVVAAAGRSWAAVGSGSGLSDRLVGIVLVSGLGLGWLVLGGRLVRGLFDRRLLRPNAQLALGVAGALSVGLVLLLAVVGHRAEWFSNNSCCGPAYDYVSTVGRGVRVPGGQLNGGGASGSGLSPLVLFGLLGIALLVLAAAALVVVRARRRASSEETVEEEALAAVTAAVGRSLDDLRLSLDPRRAVIACYARMEQSLGSAGVRRDPSEAPLEYLERVLLRLRASGDAARQLTGLFEEAKFSLHPVGESMRDRAIVALVRLRDELQAAL
jgi:Domain of unknown function (DUF4129)